MIEINELGRTIHASGQLEARPTRPAILGSEEEGAWLRRIEDSYQQPCHATLRKIGPLALYFGKTGLTGVPFCTP